ncbi:MAG: hypothetical protein ACLRFG_01485 [Clostridia bacterium]
MRPEFENSTQFINDIWKYYQMLENDLLSLEKYVALEKDNYSTYSNEFVKLYQSICAEIDVVAKILCRLLGKENVDRLDKYKLVICERLPLFTYTKLNLRSDKLEELQPWIEWSNDKCPIWWTLYNKVKHERMTICTDIEKYEHKYYYQAANLENILNSMAALLVLEFYCILLLCKIEDNYFNLKYCLNSKMFAIQDWSNYYYHFLGQEQINDEKIRTIISKYVRD